MSRGHFRQPLAREGTSTIDRPTERSATSWGGVARRAGIGQHAPLPAGRNHEALAQLRDATLLALPFALVGFLALDDGGFDLPVRQGVAIAVAWSLALAVAFGLVPRVRPPRGWGLALGALVAFAALQGMSALWGASEEKALAEACRTLGYAGVIVLAFAGLGPRSWRTAALSLFAISVAVTAWAVLGRLAPSLAGLDAIERALGTERLFAPLGYWNALAAWAAITLATALAWSADSRDRRARAAALAVVPPAAACIYLTYSRGGVLGAAVGMAIVLALTRNRPRAAVHALAAAVACTAVILVIRGEPAIAAGLGGEGGGTVGIVLAAAMAACAWVGHSTTSLGRRRRSGELSPRVRRGALAGAGALALLLAVVALVAGRDGFGRGGDSAAFTSADPAARLTTAAGNRSAYWSEAMRGLVARPLAGEGAGTFEYRWAESGSEPELVVDAHSLLFETATEYGLLGLALLGTALAALAAIALRGLAAARRNAAAVGLAAATGVYAFAAAIDWMWELTAVSYLGLGSAAVLAMAASRPAEGARVVRGGARVALATAALAAGAIQVPGLVAAELTRESLEQIALGDPYEGAVLAADALEAAPWSAAAHAARAEALLGLGEEEAALGEAKEAVRREPRSAAHRVLLFRIHAALGDPGAARAELARARALSPYSPLHSGPEVVRLEAEIGASP